MLGIRRCGSLQMILRACCRRLKLTATITLLLISLSSTIVGANEAAPPESCDDTGCTLTNAYATWNDRSTCRVCKYKTGDWFVVRITEMTVDDQ
jgi:hypothetical protein